MRISSGLTFVEGRGWREQWRLGVLSEDDGSGPVLFPLRGWQDDEAVVVHGEHGNARHHVLEPAVGLEPADAAAELLRQAVSVGRGRPGDQLAQPRDLPLREVAPVVAALDAVTHAGAVIPLLRPGVPSTKERAPVSLSEPNDRHRPTTGPQQQPLGEVVVERHAGPVRGRRSAPRGG